MDTQSYNTKMNQLFDQAHASLDPDTLRKYDEETTDELVKAEFTALMRAEGKRDPSFEEQVIREVVQTEVSRYLEDRRPTGSYRADGLFPIGNDNWMHMPEATKEHLLAWSKLEPDPANHRYIATRLVVWDQTKYPTLADLERSFNEESSH